MLTLPVEQWIGNAAAVLSGTWGAVTRRSEHSGYSRTAIYEHAERVVQAVASEQAGGISYETLWESNEQLRAEHEALWQAWSENEGLNESKQREFASVGAAMGLSLTQLDLIGDRVAPCWRAESSHGGALGAAERGASKPYPEGARPGLPALGAGVVPR